MKEKILSKCRDCKHELKSSFEIWVDKIKCEWSWKKICESSLKKKPESRKRERRPLLLSMSSLHRDEASIQSGRSLATEYCRAFLPLTKIRRGLGKAASFSVIWLFRIPISATWRVEKHTCDSVVKISWDLWFFRKREVHPLYFKLDWNSPVQLSVAPV